MVRKKSNVTNKTAGVPKERSLRIYEPASETNALVPIGSAAGVQSFDGYLHEIGGAPILGAEKEWELARRLREDNDLEAAQQLVFSNLRYVVSIARGYIGYGLPLPDLVQEGSVGLMKAIKRYDPDQKVKLMTFAAHWVRAEINDYVIKNWQIVKMATTKAQRKLFFKLRSSRPRLGWLSDSEADKIATELEVGKSDVYHMERRFSNLDTPFDSPHGGDDEEKFSPADILADYRFSPERSILQADGVDFYRMGIRQGLDKLDERSRKIIQRRWIDEDKATLKELASEYNISMERVRQIENRAMEVLRNYVSPA